MERVRGINKIQIGGKDSFEYRGNLLLNYEPILESNNLSHDKRGLLTRRQLSAGPEFGITLKPSPDLDAFHIVFGEVVDGFEVLDAISNIQQYSYKTSSGKNDKDFDLFESF